MLKDTLRELRIDKNITQKELSEKLGLSKNAICEYEKGRAEPSIQTLIELSKIFRVSVDYLVGIEDDFGNIVISGNESSDLTVSERELLLTFRKLPMLSQQKVIGYVYALAN